MKKKIAIILVGLMCVSATGCSMFGSKGANIESINTENIFTEISEEAVIEGATAADAFTNGLNAVDSAENITIKVANDMTMGTESSSNSSVIKLSKEEDKNTGSVVIDNTYKYTEEPASGEKAAAPTEEKSKITGYYSGDTLYFVTNDGDKVQEQMGFEDFMSVVNTYSLSLYNDCISKAACVEGKDKKTYYISYDAAKFETTMNTNMEASGQTLADGETMKVKYANIVADIDNDGNLLNYGFVINAEYINDTETIPYNYVISAEFTDAGSTKVDVVTDTDTYMTAEEYTQKQMEAVTEGASATENGAAEETQAAATESAN